MISGYLVTGIKFRMLMKLMCRNRMSVRLRFLLRFLFIFQNSIWSSFFSLRDRLHWGRKIEEQAVPDDPIFIIGHWRTGSTWLHQLMNLDEQLAAPTLYQTSLPESFLSARRYYAPIMKRLIGRNRPFDQMKASIDAPQEDEFALFRMTTISPMERLLFPRSGQYFLQQDCNWLPADEPAWGSALDYFYRKVVFKSGKRILLKNPFHSMRITYLKERYPNAKFIHIYRNPLDVVPSTINMWTIVGRQNTMGKLWQPPALEAVTNFYKGMMEEIEKQSAQLPQGSYAAICYEKMIKDVPGELKKLYTALGIGYTASFEQRLLSYLEEHSDYERNNYTLSEANKEYICTTMRELMRRDGYLEE